MNKRKNNTFFKVLLLQLLLIIVLIPNFMVPLFAVGTINNVEATSYLLVDRKSEIVLAGENYDQIRGIASITKLMSYYIIMTKVKEENIDLDKTIIKVNDDVVDNISSNSSLSGVFFDYGTKLPLRTMLNLMMVYSDNGATIAVAEQLFGSEEEFVELMNQQVQEWGLKNTKYYNSTGLTMSDYGTMILNGASKSDYNKSTAKEQLFIANHVINDFPEILDIVSQPYYKYKGENLKSYDLMLEGLEYSYSGVKGMKTGSSIEAGYCFLGYYVDPTDQHEYLSIVLNSPTTMMRFNDTTHIYQWAENQEYSMLAKEGTKFKVDIKGSRGGATNLYTNSDTMVASESNPQLVKTGIIYNPEYFNESNYLIKDIPEGEVVASVVYTSAVDDYKVDSLRGTNGQILINLTSKKEIKEQGIIGKIKSALIEFLSEVKGVKQ